jgi:hypothetical protein
VTDEADQVYVVQNLEVESATQAFEDEMAAVRFAERYVGNRSAAKPVPGTRLYGRGDGNTVLMVSAWPRALALSADLPIVPR